MTIYEITEQYKMLQTMVDDEDMDADVIQDTFEALDGEFEAKADGYAAVIANANLMAKSLKEESKRLAERAKLYEKKAEKLTEILQFHMQATGHDKMQTPLWSYKINKGRGSVVIDDEENIPFEYLVTKTEVDKKALNEFLKSLEDKKTDYAHLEFKDSLSIK